jgi:hypothetical protein
MSGTLRFDWNIGQDENGTISGKIEVHKDGKRVASNLLGFSKGITHFDDDALEQATLYTLAMVWRDDFKPRLHKALYSAYYEMRERNGGYIPGDEPVGEIEPLEPEEG